MMLTRAISYHLTTSQSPIPLPATPVTDPESGEHRIPPLIRRTITGLNAVNAYKNFIIPSLRFEGSRPHSVDHLTLGIPADDAVIMMETVTGLLRAVNHFNSNLASSDIDHADYADRVLETFSQIVSTGWEAKLSSQPVQREFVNALQGAAASNTVANAEANLSQMDNNCCPTQQLAVVPASLAGVLQPVIDALGDETCKQEAQNAIQQLREVQVDTIGNESQLPSNIGT